MKITKRIAAVLIAAAAALWAAFPAFAAGADVSPDAAAADAAQSAESSEQPAGSGYKPIDKSKYKKWDGVSQPSSNTKYYIDDYVKIAKDKNIVLPPTSSLVLCEGANLQIYAGGELLIRGNLLMEPESRMTVSGTLNIMAGGGFDSYGTIAATRNSLVKISSEFAALEDSYTVIGGTLNIYKTGAYINRGKTTLGAESKTTVTGIFRNRSMGELHAKGDFAVTISGSVVQAGYYSLTGEVLNSGIFIFENTVKYYTGKNSKFAASQSGRIYDYREGEKVEGAEKGSLQDSGFKGIDVSSWQGTVDWKRVKSAGIDFAFIRSSYWNEGVDKTFAYNITEAAKAGIEVGVYHYCYATTVEEAKEEARHFINTIKPYKVTYPVVLDFEDKTQVDLGKKLLTDIAKAFLDEVRAAGYYAMIYSYTNWLNDNLDMGRLADYDVWVAHWGVSAPAYRGEYGAWQYSSKGRVSGITDCDVDLNVSFKDYAKIIREGGYNHL